MATAFVSGSVAVAGNQRHQPSRSVPASATNFWFFRPLHVPQPLCDESLHRARGTTAFG